MREQAGLLLIIGGLFALWLYNTGRLEAVVGVIKNPNYQGIPPTVTAGWQGSGTTTTSGTSVCDPTNPSCLLQDFTGGNAITQMFNSVASALTFGFF